MQRADTGLQRPYALRAGYPVPQNWTPNRGTALPPLPANPNTQNQNGARPREGFTEGSFTDRGQKLNQSPVLQVQNNRNIALGQPVKTASPRDSGLHRDAVYSQDRLSEGKAVKEDDFATKHVVGLSLYFLSFFFLDFCNSSVFSSIKATGNYQTMTYMLQPCYCIKPIYEINEPLWMLSLRLSKSGCLNHFCCCF